MLDHAKSLPEPQREALRTAPFGLSGQARYRTGSWSAWPCSACCPRRRERPLICVVDDTQWLDHAPRRRWGFAARRPADPVGLVFAARVPGQDLAGLPELGVGGLAERDARALLESVLTGPLDPRVRDRIIADTNGNRWPCWSCRRADGSAATCRAGSGSAARYPWTGGSRRVSPGSWMRCRRRPGGCCSWRRPTRPATGRWCGGRPGGSRSSSRGGRCGGAGGAGEFGARVLFRHPLVRSAAYRSASPQTRRELHGALAEVTDPAADPDRRAWRATPGPDEEIAAELEQCAGRAQRRGGLAAAAAFLERSAGLTLDPARRAQRRWPQRKPSSRRAP